jgi:hypothetical protein
MAQKIRALLIFEILGRPPEHIKQALDDYVSQLDKQRGISLVSKTIHEPKLVEEKDSKDLYTTFAEAEVLIDNMNALLSIVLNMLPSSIEIIQPEELAITNSELTSALTDLTLKLHRYDEVAKTLSIEKENLLNRLREVLQKQKNMDFAVPSITVSADNSLQKKDVKKTKKVIKKDSKKETIVKTAKTNKKKKK